MLPTQLYVCCMCAVYVCVCVCMCLCRPMLFVSAVYVLSVRVSVKVVYAGMVLPYCVLVNGV